MIGIFDCNYHIVSIDTRGEGEGEGEKRGVLVRSEELVNS